MATFNDPNTHNVSRGRSKPFLGGLILLTLFLLHVALLIGVAFALGVWAFEKTLSILP